MRTFNGTKSPRVNECSYCGVTPKDQHSNFQSGQCDGVRKGYLRKDENGRLVPTGKEK